MFSSSPATLASRLAQKWPAFGWRWVLISLQGNRNMRHCTTFQSAAACCFITQFHMEGSIMTQRWSQRETVYKTFPHSLQKAVLSKPRQPYLSWELQANENFAEWLTCLWGGLPFFLVTFSEERQSQMRSLL